MDIAILVVLIGLPALLTLLLESDAALGFLALCTGFTAATYASGSTQEWLAHLSTSGQLLSANAINVIMVAAPLAITLLLTRKHGSRKKFYLEIIPALAAGGLLAIAVAPLLSNWINVDFNTVSFWKQLQSHAAIIVGVGALVSLVMVWLGGHGKKHSKKHK